MGIHHSIFLYYIFDYPVQQSGLKYLLYCLPFYSSYSCLQQILHYCPWEIQFYFFICIKYSHVSITQQVSANSLSSFVPPSLFPSFLSLIAWDKILYIPRWTLTSICSQQWLWTHILPASTSCQYIHESLCLVCSAQDWILGVMVKNQVLYQLRYMSRPLESFFPLSLILGYLPSLPCFQ